MSREEIIEALAHLVALLVAERNSPPESGGWVRTENTAYRPPTPKGGEREPESKKRAQNAPIGARIGLVGVGKGNNHPGSVSCSICGKERVNKRTCISIHGEQEHREPRPRPISRNEPQW